MSRSSELGRAGGEGLKTRAFTRAFISFFPPICLAKPPQFSLSIGKISILSDLFGHVHLLLPHVLEDAASALACTGNITYTFLVVFPPACVHLLVLLGYRVRNAV